MTLTVRSITTLAMFLWLMIPSVSKGAEIGFFSETHFYWSPSRDEVLFISLNSRGIVSEGVAHWQDGTMPVLMGVARNA